MSIRLTSEFIRQLEEESELQGVSVSRLVRYSVDFVLKELKRKREEEQMQKYYAEQNEAKRRNKK